MGLVCAGKGLREPEDVLPLLPGEGVNLNYQSVLFNLGVPPNTTHLSRECTINTSFVPYLRLRPTP